MIFYIFLFAIYICIALKKTTKHDIKVGIISLVCLCFFSAFRGETVGTDTVSYLDLAVKDIDVSEMLRRPEFIYYSLANFLLIKGLSMRYLILFFSVVTFAFLYLSAKRTNASITLVSFVFLLLFYFYSFNIARQIAAVSIILYGYTFINENSLRKRCNFFLLVSLATLFHASSMLAIIAYFFRKVSLPSRMLFGIACVLFLVNIISPFNIMVLFENLFSDSFYASKYASEANIYERSGFGILVDVINIMIMLFVFLLQTKGRKTEFNDNLFLFSVLSTMLSTSLNSNVGRVVFIFSIFQVLYLSDFFEKKDVFPTVKLIFVCWIVFNAFFDLYNASNGYGDIVPYIIDFNFK
ncbi:MAG TPA: hypothetical protein DDW20_00665 [Firmicutes bacterium]|nr:hypothetical protein [Bacillota bacterium]